MRWLRRALSSPGTERLHLIQSVKAAIAAVLAWLVAAELLRLPQPFLAPYAAIFLVELTVYRSIRSTLQQVGSVGAAVLLAAAVQALVPWTVPALGVVVLAGLLIGRWHGFGESGDWVAITAVLLLTWGAAGNGVLLVDRLVETALGAVIGTLVNALLFPPLYTRDARETTERVATRLGDLLTGIAEELRREHKPESRHDWVRTARDAERLMRQAERAVEWSRESRRMNLRRRRARLPAREEPYRHVLASLHASWPHLHGMIEAIRNSVERDEAVQRPDPESRRRLADLLDGLGEAIRLRVRDGSSDQLDRTATRCRELIDELHERLEATPGDALGLAVDLAGMLLPARHALRELTAR